MARDGFRQDGRSSEFRNFNASSMRQTYRTDDGCLGDLGLSCALGFNMAGNFDVAAERILHPAHKNS